MTFLYMNYIPHLSGDPSSVTVGVQFIWPIIKWVIIYYLGGMYLPLTEVLKY